MLLRAPSQFRQMSVETFELRKKADVETALVKNAYRIVRIDCCDELVFRTFYGLEMSGDDKARHTGDCEILDHTVLLAQKMV